MDIGTIADNIGWIVPAGIGGIYLTIDAFSAYATRVSSINLIKKDPDCLKHIKEQLDKSREESPTIGPFTYFANREFDGLMKDYDKTKSLEGISSQ